jgi:hypothetical protein
MIDVWGRVERGAVCESGADVVVRCAHDQFEVRPCAAYSFALSFGIDGDVWGEADAVAVQRGEVGDGGDA